MLNALIVGVGLLSVGSDPANTPEEMRIYQDARAQAKRDPAAHIRLALWCEAHGLEAERLKHLAIALLADPKNATARGLMGFVAHGGRWQNPEAVARKVQEDATLAAALAEYNERRARTPRTADAQWQLALWCGQKGLKAEATAHLSTVVRLDPRREEAWKRMGYKKHNGRWMTDEQVGNERAEVEAQKRADRHWKPLLEKWRGWLTNTSKRSEAESALAAITDPRALGSVWKVFAAGGEGDQTQAVQLLGQMEGPGASRALANLSVFGKSAEVRRIATETLTRRDPREAIEFLIALLRDPIKYEVRPADGPGSPAALFVEGRKINVRRLYESLPTPDLTLLPGDSLEYDENGLPVISRNWGDAVASQSIGPVPAQPPESAAALANALPGMMGQGQLGAQAAQLGQQLAGAITAGPPIPAGPKGSIPFKVTSSSSST